MASTLDMFADPAPVVAGFRHVADLVDQEAEAELVHRFADLPFAPFDFRGFKGNRETVAYGSRYDLTRSQVKEAAAIPDWLEPLKAAVAVFADVPNDALVQALITRYRPGAGIGWHRDRPEYGKVVGVSFGNPCVLRLRREDGDSWVRRAVELAPRSAYLLDGEARDDWQHSITPQGPGTVFGHLPNLALIVTPTSV